MRDVADLDEDRGLARVGKFPVDLPVFQGPFRVLAELLLDRKVDVCDVPVAQVTADFLARADEAEGWTLEEATWFLAICAVLLELKVGRLFPRQREPDEEDLLGGSPDLAFARALELTAFRHVAGVLAERFREGTRYFPRAAGPAEEFRDLYPDLLGGSPDLAFARALELTAFRHVAGVLAERFREGTRYFPRAAGPAEEFRDLYPDLLERVTPETLAETAVALFRPPVVDLSHVTPIRATVAEALATVRRRMARRGEARFRDLVRDCRERIHVVVRFLALLELHAQGRVALRQAETFGEIQVRWEG
jgi:segregation and condensation protein A